MTSKKKQAEKAAARNSAPRWLSELGVSFSIRNNGAHIIINTESHVIDFWPGSSKWSVDKKPCFVGTENLRDFLEYSVLPPESSKLFV